MGHSMSHKVKHYLSPRNLTFSQSIHISLHMEFLSELWQFMSERKKFWLAPIIITLMLLGLLLVFGGGSAVAPFVYTLF